MYTQIRSNPLQCASKPPREVDRLNAHSIRFESMRIQCGRNQCAFDAHSMRIECVVWTGLKDASYVPRWGKRKQRACCVLHCKNDVHASSKMGSTEEIKATFEEAQLQYASISTPTPLCKVHYHIIYNLMQPRQTHCSTCGLSLRHTTSRPCPQTDIIQSHLREVIGFEGSIGAGDKVCYSCYKSHLVILKSSKNISRDCELVAAHLRAGGAGLHGVVRRDSRKVQTAL